MNIQGYSVGIRQIIAIVLLILVVVFWAVGEPLDRDKILVMFGLTAVGLLL